MTLLERQIGDSLRDLGCGIGRTAQPAREAAERMKVSDLATGEGLPTGDRNDPEYRAEWDRTRLAHEVAMRVAAYRTEHKLTQTELARMLGMRQPHIARLEAGEHEPSLTTLSRLARVLDMEFHIDITRSALRLTA